MCFFVSIQHRNYLLESSIGACQFCGAKASVDLVDQYTKWYIFGFLPTEEKVERLASCKQCGKIVKEAYYTLRNNIESTSPPSVEKKFPLILEGQPA
jgi:hypothetical protein